MQGLSAAIHLPVGIHQLTPWNINGTIRASEVRFVGEGQSATEGASILELTSTSSILESGSAATRLFTVSADAPRIVLQGLVLRGSIAVQGSTLHMINCRFEHCRANEGGAILATNGSIFAINVDFLNNTATSGDGGAVLFSGSAGGSFSNCLFNGNVATARGGALALAGSANVDLSDGTFLVGNTAPTGRSMYYAGAPALVVYALPAPLGRWIEGSVGGSGSPLAVEGGLDLEYPFACGAGFVGYDTNAQQSYLCSGSCPPGRLCPPATFAPSNCSFGAFCPEGSITPTPCPAGSWSNVHGLQSTSQCNACPLGNKCAAGSVQPKPCASGHHPPNVRQESCDACAAGGYQPDTNATACITCGAGSHCQSGASAELPCLKGSYSNATGLSSREQCLNCPAGSACPTGSVEPTACNPGTHAAGSSSLCTACAAGNYQTERGATGCELCSPGYHCSEGASSPLPCQAGTYRTSPGARGQEECSTCPSGSECPVASTQPRLCPLGSHATHRGEASCTRCPAGSFSDGHGLAGSPSPPPLPSRPPTAPSGRRLSAAQEMAPALVVVARAG